jgi:hypothetical protein
MTIGFGSVAPASPTCPDPLLIRAALGPPAVTSTGISIRVDPLAATMTPEPSGPNGATTPLDDTRIKVGAELE